MFIKQHKTNLKARQATFDVYIVIVQAGHIPLDVVANSQCVLQESLFAFAH